MDRAQMISFALRHDLPFDNSDTDEEIKDMLVEKLLWFYVSKTMETPGKTIWEFYDPSGVQHLDEFLLVVGLAPWAAEQLLNQQWQSMLSRVFTSVRQHRGEQR